MDDQEFRVTWLTGVKVLKPVEDRIVEKVTGPWWWRRTEYWIENDFCRWGPFDSRDRVEQIVRTALTSPRT